MDLLGAIKITINPEIRGDDCTPFHSVTEVLSTDTGTWQRGNCTKETMLEAVNLRFADGN